MTKDSETLFATLRFRQLFSLVNPSKDPKLGWTEIRAVRKKFFDGYTLKTEPVEVTATKEERENLRRHAIFAIRTELAEQGFKTAADGIIENAQSKTKNEDPIQQNHIKNILRKTKPQET